jgi:hypothetical protein
MAMAITTVARVTGTATSRALLVGLLALGAAGSGCGSSARTPPAAPVQRSAGLASSSVNAARLGYTWPAPAPAPATWRHIRLDSGATMAYPPGWRVLAGDPNTATAALLDPHGQYLGYLNLTPRQGHEAQTSWASFRPHHNVAEGEKAVTAMDSATGLRFRGGQGSCVRDAYTTSAHIRYVEIACLVNGRHASSVIVGAAPSERWAQERSIIERAISALIT